MRHMLLTLTTILVCSLVTISVLNHTDAAEKKQWTCYSFSTKASDTCWGKNTDLNKKDAEAGAFVNCLDQCGNDNCDPNQAACVYR